MNKVYQAERLDGTFQLVPQSIIRKCAAQAKRVGRVDAHRGVREFSRLLSIFCFVNGYASIVEIAYGTDGSQTRTTLIRRAA